MAGTAKTKVSPGKHMMPSGKPMPDKDMGKMPPKKMPMKGGKYG